MLSRARLIHVTARSVARAAQQQLRPTRLVDSHSTGGVVFRSFTSVASLRYLELTANARPMSPASQYAYALALKE